MKSFGKIKPRFNKLFKLGMVVIDIGRINMKLESLVEQIKLSRKSNCPKESSEMIPNSLQD